MLHTFKRVVVLINNIKNIDELLQKGIEFSKQHKTTLEVLFVQEKPSHSLFDYFLSSSSETYSPLDKDMVKAKIQKYIDELDNSIQSEVFIVEEDTLQRVLTHGKEGRNILFITNYNEKLSQKLLEKTPYSYWIFKNDSLNHTNILLPIVLSESAKEDIKLTQDIFPKSSIGIVHDYRYKIPTIKSDGFVSIIPIVSNIDSEFHKEAREKQKNIFEDYKKEFNVKGDFIEEKKGVEKDLLNYIKNRDTDLIVLHHQEEEMFIPSLTFNLLDEVPNDFLVINR